MINYAIKQVPCFKMDSSLEYALLCDDGGFYRPFSGTHDAYKSSGFFFYVSPLLELSVHVLGQWKRMCSFKESCIFLRPNFLQRVCLSCLSMFNFFMKFFVLEVALNCSSVFPDVCKYLRQI